jgi:hypothetical protein
MKRIEALKTMLSDLMKRNNLNFPDSLCLKGGIVTSTDLKNFKLKGAC